jgi:hypothetical protein
MAFYKDIVTGAIPLLLGDHRIARTVQGQAGVFSILGQINLQNYAQLLPVIGLWVYGLFGFYRGTGCQKNH